MATEKKAPKVKLSEVFKGRLQAADAEATKLTAGNAAMAKTMRAAAYMAAERDLKGQRIGTKNGEKEMIVFPDKSAVLAELVASVSGAVVTGKFLRP